MMISSFSEFNVFKIRQKRFSTFQLRRYTIKSCFKYPRRCEQESNFVFLSRVQLTLWNTRSSTLTNGSRVGITINHFETETLWIQRCRKQRKQKTCSYSLCVIIVVIHLNAIDTYGNFNNDLVCIDWKPTTRRVFSMNQNESKYTHVLRK